MKSNLVPIWRATVEGGKLRLRNPKEFAIYVAKLEGQDLDFVIRRPKDIRSLNQNAYYHGVVVQLIAEELGYDHDDCHELLKLKFNSKIINVLGKEVTVAKSTARLSRKGFTDFIEAIRVWAASNLNLSIPDPNEVEIDYEWDNEN